MLQIDLRYLQRFLSSPYKINLQLIFLLEEDMTDELEPKVRDPKKTFAMTFKVSYLAKHNEKKICAASES